MLSKGDNKKIKPRSHNSSAHKDLLKRVKGIFKESLKVDGWKMPTVQKWFIALVLVIIITFILSPDIQFFTHRYNVGDVAVRNIKSTQDLLIEDVSSTEKKREEVKKELKSIYDLDPLVLPKTEQRLKKAFADMQGFYGGKGAADKTLKPRLTNDLKAEKERFYKALGVELTEEEYARLEMTNFDDSIVDTAVGWINPIFNAGLVSDKALLLSDRDKGILIRDIQTKKEKIIADITALYDLKEARKEISRFLKNGQGIDGSLRKIANKIAQNALIPNLTFNKSATEERNKELLSGVKPVYFQVKKGEIIVREGERITEDDFIKLQGLLEETKKQRVPLFAIGILVLTLIVLITSYHFSHQNIRKFKSHPKDILLMGLVLIGTLVLIKFSIFVAQSFEENFPIIPATAYTYAIPVVAGAMIVRLFLNSETALIFAVVLSFLSAVILERDLFYALYFLLGSLAGAGGLKHCTQRVVIIKAGFIAGIVNACIIIALSLVTSSYGLKDSLLSIPFGFMGGIVASIVVTGLTPLVEHGLGYTSNIKLLELGRMDHPLLKELALQAPGTYHHSIIIGSLVEAAAEAINANPLLARVSAFYHDIGKMNKPVYFVENQTGENRHERLTPSMSALILISHVKDGTEMAKCYRLGKEITDIIKEHHGTSLITYFYQKAKEGEEPDIHEIKEEDFRYPGPKPQTKEAGLVMLADAVEAACRTIPEPTSTKIQGAVHKIINKIFADGQLDECELTLRDLNEIAKVFNRVLSGIYHTRIDYPEPAYITKSLVGKDYEKENTQGPDREQEEWSRVRHANFKKGSKRGLKRLGVSRR